MQQPPRPEPRDLLPPLLACLPTTFLSPRPPPALLPLLAPILRQRVNYLASTSNSRDGWVRLLSWEGQSAAKLPAVVESLDLEPHPVSGEVEIEEIDTIEYRRLDNETLRARLQVEQFRLLPIYVWCQNDEHGETGPGWKLAELRALEDLEDGNLWYESIMEANRAFSSQSRKVSRSGTSAAAQVVEDDADDNDDYWAAYDRTPGRTPSLQQTPGSRGPIIRPPMPNTEEDYYSRYGAEVQPALDAHDPDEEIEGTGDSTLTGTQQQLRPEVSDADQEDADGRPAWEKALYPHVSGRNAHDSAVATSLAQSVHSELNMPRPISPASSQHSVEKLEEQAAALSDDSSNSRVEMGVKQHISTDIKSLFRLAKSTGMNRKEFEHVVKRELEVLSLLDDD